MNGHLVTENGHTVYWLSLSNDLTGWRVNHPMPETWRGPAHRRFLGQAVFSVAAITAPPETPGLMP